MNRLKIKAAVFLFLGPVLLFSCSQKLASLEKNFQNSCWKGEDSLVVHFVNTEISGQFNLKAKITFTQDFNYNNLYLKSMIISPSRQVKAIITSFLVRNPDGSWINGAANSSKSLEFDLLKNEVLGEKGEFTFSVQHYMQEGLQCGVSATEIWLTRADH